MAYVHTTEVDTILEPANTEPWNFILWQNFKWRTTFNETLFVKIQTYKCGGQLEVNIQILL
jgi:hypothetical protein